MRISRLRLENVRNLRATEIEPAAGVNLIHGNNASGKTSLLETLFVLSRGKSFRTSQLRHLIQKGQADFTVHAQLDGDAHHSMDIGVSYQKQRLKLRARGSPVKKASQLASILPLVVIHQESHRLLLEGPVQRRNFMDWALFHVEPSFHAVWHRYNRALKQRNGALQQHAARKACEVWNDMLEAAARVIHRQRKEFIDGLKPAFEVFLKDLLPDMIQVQMDYHGGWPEDRDYKVMLEESFAGDHACGYTRFGPHRADMVLRQDGIALKDRVSRGQQKLLVCALYLAQLGYFTGKTGKPCILLIDDIAAELDVIHRNLLLERIRALNIQVFLTATDSLKDVPDHLIQKRFHVEHGKVEQVL